MGFPRPIPGFGRPIPGFGRPLNVADRSVADCVGRPLDSGGHVARGAPLCLRHLPPPSGGRGDPGDIFTRGSGGRRDPGDIFTRGSGGRRDPGDIFTRRAGGRGDPGGIFTRGSGGRGDPGGIFTRRAGGRGDPGGIFTRKVGGVASAHSEMAPREWELPEAEGEAVRRPRLARLGASPSVAARQLPLGGSDWIGLLGGGCLDR